MFRIGATNFRKFQRLEPVEIRPITFLVGRNNSGKSSLVKAVMLVNNYLNSKTLEKFSFVNNILNDTNVISFGRAKNRVNPELNTIEFELELNEFSIQIVVSGNDDDSNAKVLDLVIKDTLRGFLFEFDFRINSADNPAVNISSFYPNRSTPNQIESMINKLTEFFKILKMEKDNWEGKKNTKEYLEIVDKLAQLEIKIGLQNIPGFSIDMPNTLPNTTFDRTELCPYIWQKGLQDLAEALKDDIELGYEPLIGKEGTVDADDDTSLFYLSYKNAYDHREQWAASFRIFSRLLTNREFHFIGATSMKQNSLMSIKDSSNPLAVAVHDYYQNHLYKIEEFHSFVLKWFRLFEIGEDFSIEIHEGEAYSIKVLSGNCSVPIADKGMGSIQAFIIILKLAFLGSQNNERHPSTIMLEEPELNLHPALQSLLADLLLEAHETFKLEFIVETHSEYLIRKTQVLVKDKEFEVKPNENPFSVIYFDKDERQWRMNYREDGKFIEDFGQGFYNESARLTIDLL
jgi:predicted ATPase